MRILPGLPPVITATDTDAIESIEEALGSEGRLYIEADAITLPLDGSLPVDPLRKVSTKARDNYIINRYIVAGNGAPPASLGSLGDIWVSASGTTGSIFARGESAWVTVGKKPLSWENPGLKLLLTINAQCRLYWVKHRTYTEHRQNYNNGMQHRLPDVPCWRDLTTDRIATFMVSFATRIALVTEDVFDPVKIAPASLVSFRADGRILMTPKVLDSLEKRRTAEAHAQRCLPSSDSTSDLLHSPLVLVTSASISPGPHETNAHEFLRPIALPSVLDVQSVADIQTNPSCSVTSNLQRPAPLVVHEYSGSPSSDAIKAHDPSHMAPSSGSGSDSMVLSDTLPPMSPLSELSTGLPYTTDPLPRDLAVPEPADSAEEFALPSARPTYPPSTPCNALLPDPSSTQFPSDTPTCTWWNGMKTHLPFILERTPPQLRGRGSEDLDPDRRLVMWAAQSTGDATARTSREGEPLVDSFDYGSVHSFSQRNSLAASIQSSLRHGRSVVITNWTTDTQLPWRWDEETASEVFSDLDDSVQWQDAERRAHIRAQHRKGNNIPNEPYREGTVREFLATAEDPTQCANLLDAPQLQGVQPPFVKRISHNMDAIAETRKIGHRIKHGNSQVDVPLVAPGDHLDLSSWVLMANGGFLTYPHHDAHGMATWVSVLSGGKMWTLFRPRGDEQARKRSLVKLADSAPDDLPEDVANAFDTGTLTLLPGSVFIQCPGAFHMVYTPVKTVTIGGHFLAWEALPHTLLAREVEIESEGSGTNAVHPATFWWFARMAISLSVNPTKRAQIEIAALNGLLRTASQVETDSDEERKCMQRPELQADIKHGLRIVEDMVKRPELGADRTSAGNGKVNGSRNRKRKRDDDYDPNA